MALDRRLIIQEMSEVRNDFGEVSGLWTDVAVVWAERRGAGTVDVEEEGGVVELESATWTVRWTSRLARLRIANTRLISVFQSEPFTLNGEILTLSGSPLTWGPTADVNRWNVEGIQESDRRRRFLEFRAVRENCDPREA